MNKKIIGIIGRCSAVLIFILTVLLTSCMFGNSSDVETTDSSTESAFETTTEFYEGTVELPEEVRDPRLLHNGIYLPEVWPPQNVSKIFEEVIEAPYLYEISEGGMHPEVVNIDVGRQLFVDNFLIESTNLTSTNHKAEVY